MKHWWLLARGLVAIGLAGGLTGCSGGDDGGSAADTVTITGNLRGVTATVGEHAGWHLVFAERDSGVTRVATVSATGRYELKGAEPGAATTIVLLDTQMQLRAVLGFSGAAAQQIRQFFVLNIRLPDLVQTGQSLQFSNHDDLVVTDDWARDSDGDGVADGIADSSKLQPTVATPLAANDNDGDGVANDTDPDVDGDGIINRFDSDIAGSGIPNALNRDANGNGIADSKEAISEAHFSKGAVYFVPQIIQYLAAGGGVAETQMVFHAKLRPEWQPDKVVILGSSKTFSGVTTLVRDPDANTEKEKVWDLSLADDGLNGDGSSADGLYGRKIILKNGLPAAREVVFLRLQFGSDPKQAHYLDLPATLPTISSQHFSVTYSNNQFTLAPGIAVFRDNSGGTSNRFHAYGQLFDETVSPRIKVYDTASVDASSLDPSANGINLPVKASAVTAGSYTGYVVAYAHGIRVAGIPTWTVVSGSVTAAVKLF